MFVKSKYDSSIQTVKIEFGTLVGCEKDDEAYIVLKELPTIDTIKLAETRDEGTSAMLEFLREVLPHAIAGHNLYETEDKKMSNGDVVDFIYERLDLSMKVLNGYTSATFFTRMNKVADK